MPFGFIPSFTYMRNWSLPKLRLTRNTKKSSRIGCTPVRRLIRIFDFLAPGVLRFGNAFFQTWTNLGQLRISVLVSACVL